MQLKSILGFLPHNITLYQTALMHKSLTLHEKGAKHINNERLEYLGDAMLGAVVADILYQRYPNKQEGFLTTLRSKLVRRDTLNKLAVQIGLDKLVLYSGRATSAHNSYMNGNAFEAFFGAIYLDRGYDYCMPTTWCLQSTSASRRFRRQRKTTRVNSLSGARNTSLILSLTSFLRKSCKTATRRSSCRKSPSRVFIAALAKAIRKRKAIRMRLDRHTSTSVAMRLL